MLEFARNLEFEKAAAARDELFRIRKQVFGISGGIAFVSQTAAPGTASDPASEAQVALLRESKQ
jgi:hypothetical protein